MSKPASTKEFLKLLDQSQVLAPKVMSSVRRKVETLSDSVRTDPRRLAATLVNSKIITSWQARRLLSGKGSGFYVGRYKLLDMIGSGGMGRVYLAEHLKMHQLVAIKILRPLKGKSKAAEKEIVARFTREAQAIAALNHPNIVRAIDFDEAGHLRYLVMEFVEGVDASTQLMKTGPLPYEQVADYICQAAAGLKHAHESGLVHRDVKPANLLVDMSGVVKIVDLGLVSCLPDETDDGLTIDEYKLGTVDFIAPEQALSSHDVDARADIYALGGSFYRLISGKLLFPNLNTAQKLLAQQTKEPRPIAELCPGLPQPLVNAINKMLAKNRDDRYDDVAEIIDVVQPFAKRIEPPFDSKIIPHVRGEIDLYLRRGPMSLTTGTKIPAAEPVQTPEVSAPDLVPADSIVIAQPLQQRADSSMTTLNLGPPVSSDKRKQTGVPARAIVGGLVGLLAIAGIAYVATRPGTEPEPSPTTVADDDSTKPTVAAKPPGPKPTPTVQPDQTAPATIKPPREKKPVPATVFNPIVRNTGFELDTDANQWPDSCGQPRGAGVAWVTENDNHFIRIECVAPGEPIMLYREIKLPDDVEAIRVEWRQRITGLVVGDKKWHAARMMMSFLGEAEGSKFEIDEIPSTSADTKGWVRKSIDVPIPTAAVKFKLMPSLFRVQAGQFDVDDLVVSVRFSESAQTQSIPRATVVESLLIASAVPDPKTDATGDGQITAADEYVSITNIGERGINLTGYSLCDSVGLLHIFPHKTWLKPGTSIRVLTGELNASNRSARNGAWNNGGDHIILSDPEGQLVDQQTYEKAREGEELIFSKSSG